jgi:hypothetical protein
MGYKDSMESLKEKVLDLHSSLCIYFKSLSLNIIVFFLAILTKKNELNCQNHEINRLSKTLVLFLSYLYYHHFLMH